ncbi:hypothetical protein L291_0560 [Acinetobacter guillouiae MSP4-18]|uniref:zinc-ribbon and DUF3426 domain-containing protein n=1 Tax=Acinetobacter TaxID=469 RepID=UPI0002CFF254|nr:MULTISPECIES: zinc-ribbon and DUF3426 domain-containing protein [Acinetobacter]ENU59158.1 hypothetical protein F981_01251 [Acinetobacter guillouiae CIP 63.46]EPH37150.1 hypothetical protein L291_0560 [Acinetobacter guillouiae MSP4-18]KAB0628599.1 DUF3426 domain-containing protein [Acinetobacter guillouiae]KQX02793.1 hypothetical protein ASC84_14905 [Acinetobacter sp. Root1280]
MTEKQTRCPNCASVYKVSVTQLTVAQGMVCCPKCSHNFNALIHLQNSQPAQPKIDPDTVVQNQAQNLITTKRQIETNVLDIFNRKIENSNIDLRTYLNNLNYFNNEPVNNIPSLNLSQGLNNYGQHLIKPKSTFYYLAWSLINLALLSILLFQILWFNPNLTDRYPFLNTVFTQTCAVLQCDTVDQRYKQIVISHLKVKALGRDETQFSGQLNNQYSKSLELPLIRVTLKAQNKVIATHVITPEQYLIESLVGIKRIPKNSPYPFKFVVTEPRKSFDQYQLDIIHP